MSEAVTFDDGIDVTVAVACEYVFVHVCINLHFVSLVWIKM